MKKITQAADLGGAPFNKADFRTVYNDEIWDAIESLLAAVATDTEGVIVSGCTVTGSGPYDIAEGMVILNGEFMRFPGASGVTFPQYIAAAAPVNDDRVFSDTTTHTLFITKSAELVGAAPGSGQYITMSATKTSDVRRLWQPVLNKRSITTDLNDIVDNGLYYAETGALNKPSGVDNGYILSQNLDTDYRSQTYIPFNVNRVFFRRRVPAGWEAWAEIPVFTATNGLDISGGIRTESSGPYFKTKVVEIGDWNMDTTATKTVPHGLGVNWTKIRSITGVVRNDSDNEYVVFGAVNSAGGNYVSAEVFGPTNINLVRVTSSYVDSTSYDSTSYNRGWVTIWYEA